MNEDEQSGLGQPAVTSFEVEAEASPVQHVETYIEGKILGNGLKPEQLDRKSVV